MGKDMLPMVNFGGAKVSRLICGCNPITGYSHFSEEKDWEFRKYYNFENTLKLVAECEKNGINTMQLRGDKFYLRLVLDHRERGGKMNFIFVTANELKDIKANIREMKQYGPIAVYFHGTYVDNTWHEGKIDEIRDYIKFMKDNGIYAGVGSHIPEVIEYAEENKWENDFYMCCLYNLAKKTKTVQGINAAGVEEKFQDADRDKMTDMILKVKKPCLAFKLLAAGRNCKDKNSVEKAFKYAFDRIKPTDAVVVGMYQKDKNQVKENAEIVRKINKESKYSK